MIKGNVPDNTLKLVREYLISSNEYRRGMTYAVFLYNDFMRDHARPVDWGGWHGVFQRHGYDIMNKSIPVCYENSPYALWGTYVNAARSIVIGCKHEADAVRLLLQFS